MKYIFIVGLEHSGSTLTDHLLSGHPQVLGLGEVANFFSPRHMTNYIKRWGSYPDSRLCSCGQSWQECDFWGSIEYLNGLSSNKPLLEKYALLFEQACKIYSDNTVLVDSSKNISVLILLLDNMHKLGLKSNDILVIFTLKDVRSFCASVVRKKNDQSGTLIKKLQTFNWWFKSNRDILASLEKNNVKFVVNLYENLCRKPQVFVNEIWRCCELDTNNFTGVSHNDSHVVLGNKNFIHRNRLSIVYDFDWFKDDQINLAYLLHWQARSFNKKLYKYSEDFFKSEG